VQEVKQASGLYSNASAIRERIYRNIREQIEADVVARTQQDSDSRAAKPDIIQPGRNVRIVRKQPSREYENAHLKGMTAFSSTPDVKLSGVAEQKIGSVADATGVIAQVSGDNALAQLLTSSQAQSNTDNAAAGGGHQDRKNAFVKANTNTGANSDQSEYLASTRRAPLTKYELKAGSIISGVMVGGINSDLPGTTLGQVTENVFDTATGKYLLIPQGSRMVGTYDSDVVYGQNRLIVVWNRIVFPDGTSLNLEGMLGSDQRGYAGFKHRVDHHYGRMLGAALFASVFVAAGKEVTKDDTSSSSRSGRDRNTSSIFAESLMENVTDVATKMIEKNLNIAPTLRIFPGYRFSIITTKDVSFAEPYVIPKGGSR
jgi:type IV secretion system protein VirB10